MRAILDFIIAWTLILTFGISILLIIGLFLLLSIRNDINDLKRIKTPVMQDNAGIRVSYGIKAIVYGYNSLPEQTDATPDITASGQKTRKGIVANNCLPFGRKVIIEDVTYEIQDRMSARYGCEVFDIWFETKTEALLWGKRELTIRYGN